VHRCDVVVAGAGVAGCATAILLAREGRSVALVESHADVGAYKRVCTHLIQSSALPAIERLGVRPAIDSAGGAYTLSDLWTRWGWIRVPLRDGEPRFGRNLNIRRERLDPLLRRAAAETPGVELLLGCEVSGLLNENGAVRGVRVSSREIGADLVVAADGRNSRVAELSSTRVRVDANQRFAYYAYFAGLPFDRERSIVWMVEPDMDVAYALPTDDGLTLLSAFPVKGKLAAWREDPGQELTALFAGLDGAPDPREGERVSPWIGRLDMPNITRPPARSGLAFVGDAALAMDPAVGVGVGWAFQSAEWLAQALREQGDVDAGLHAYAERHRKELSGHAALIVRGSRAQPYGPGESLLYRAAMRDPELAELAHGYATRNIQPREFLSPRNQLRAARRALTRR
jgi:2-polyprenyl-6-methoxyphenol hydroxylase-like FAD-dependent oxidoreductase